MALKYYIVDAFVNESKRYSGNPAGVIILKSDSDISDEDKQGIASELNLAETAFVSALNDGGEDRFLIRWFSPATEVGLCGHATLASAFILYTQANIYSDIVKSDEPLRFRTRFGAQLQTTIDTAESFVTLNFPANTPVPAKYGWLDQVKKGIAGSEEGAKWFVGEPEMAGNRFLVLRLRDDVEISAVQPNISELLQIAIPKGELIAVAVTKKNDYRTTGKHYESRCFGPWVGINEDPVTGSSFTALTPFWSRVYKQVYGEPVDVFYSLQASERTGMVKNELASDGTRVLIAGRASIFSKGEIESSNLEEDFEKLQLWTWF